MLTIRLKALVQWNLLGMGGIKGKVVSQQYSQGFAALYMCIMYKTTQYCWESGSIYIYLLMMMMPCLQCCDCHFAFCDPQWILMTQCLLVLVPLLFISSVQWLRRSCN